MPEKLPSGPGDEDLLLDQTRVRRAFGRAAGTYDDFAVLQKQVREQLLERLELVLIEPDVVLDVGTGTGWASAALARRYRRARVVAIDLVPEMLREARRRRRWRTRFSLACADAHALPLPDASADLIFCSLVVEWCNDLDAVLREFHRVLAPRGLLTFTTAGPDTLRELRTAWAHADRDTHVHRFLDMHDIGDALMRAGFVEPVMDVERYTLTYENVAALMRDLKRCGAGNLTRARPRGLTSRARMAGMERGYERFRRDGRLPASAEIVYGHAWRPVPGVGVGLEDGEARIPLDAIRRRR